MTSQRPYVKSPRKIRGEWYKAAREDAIHAIRAKVSKKPIVNPDGSKLYPKATGAERDRIALAIYFVSAYYKLRLRLPDLRRYEPKCVEKITQIIDHAYDRTYLLAPYLTLLEYEPKDWISAYDAEAPSG